VSSASCLSLTFLSRCSVAQLFLISHLSSCRSRSSDSACTAMSERKSARPRRLTGQWRQHALAGKLSSAQRSHLHSGADMCIFFFVDRLHSTAMNPDYRLQPTIGTNYEMSDPQLGSSSRTAEMRSWKLRGLRFVSLRIQAASVARPHAPVRTSFLFCLPRLLHCVCCEGSSGDFGQREAAKVRRDRESHIEEWREANGTGA
jgi:hypothetical protein